MFFEYNLPSVMPSYICDENREWFNETLHRVSARMDKLEEALSLSGMSGEVFSLAVEHLFNPDDDLHIIDSMTPQAIANFAGLLGYGITAEPRLEWTNAEVVVDTAFVGRREWETLRMLGMGGSDAAVVLGISPYNTPQALYHSKCGTKFEKEESIDLGKDYIFEYGHRMEDMVINQFCKRNGCRRVRETRMFRSKENPFITANIDAIVQFPDGRMAIFEAKTTVFFNKDAWADNGCPAYYVPQCNQYMYVLNDDRIKEIYIGCIFGNTPDDFRCGRLPRNVLQENDQISAEVDFWNNHVKAHVEPCPSGNAKLDYELAIKKFGNADIKTKKNEIELPKSLEESLQQYTEIRERRRQTEEQVKELKAMETSASLPVIAALGENIKGKLTTKDCTFRVTYNPVRKSKVDMERLSLCYPEAYNDCVHTPEESYRTFSVKISNIS